MYCLFFSGAESHLLALPGCLVAHMTTHLGIHSFLSKKLPSVPCLAPELPRKVESSPTLAMQGRVLPSLHLPLQGTLGTLVPQGTREITVSLGIQAGSSCTFGLCKPGMGKLLLFTSLICATALLAAGGQNCLTHSSLCPVSITSLSTAPQHKLQHCAAQTCL